MNYLVITPCLVGENSHRRTHFGTYTSGDDVLTLLSGEEMMRDLAILKFDAMLELIFSIELVTKRPDALFVYVSQLSVDIGMKFTALFPASKVTVFYTGSISEARMNALAKEWPHRNRHLHACGRGGSVALQDAIDEISLDWKRC